MRTVLQYDEESEEFKDKPSSLQVFFLESAEKEIELGSTPFNLAQFAKEPLTTSKLYVNGFKDMYIEIVVKSKPVD